MLFQDKNLFSKRTVVDQVESVFALMTMHESQAQMCWPNFFIFLLHKRYFITTRIPSIWRETFFTLTTMKVSWVIDLVGVNNSEIKNLFPSTQLSIAIKANGLREILHLRNYSSVLHRYLYSYPETINIFILFFVCMAWHFTSK